MLPATTSRFSVFPLIRRTAATIAIILSLCWLSLGQSTPSGRGTSQDTAQSTDASLGAQNSSQTTDQPEESSGLAVPEEKKKQRRGSFVVAPIPLSSPAVGSGIIPVVGYIFPLSKNDKMSPPSAIGAAGLITNNDSRALALGAQLFFKQNTYQVTAVYVRGNLNYNFYGPGVAAGDAGLRLPLKQEGAAFRGEFLRRLKWKFFAGPRVMTGHSVITLRPGGSVTVPIPSEVGLRTSLTSVGFIIQRDTRPNRYYPVSGTMFQFTSDFFANAFGSKYSFQTYRATFSKYWSLSKNQVLAYNAYFCATGGQPPFYGKCIYGTNNELRGYEAGRYFDRYMTATQLEYRLALPMRFGLVGFGGIGAVAPGGRDFFRSNAFLPAGGGGLRFILSKAYHVNLRADIAAGKNEHTFSIGVSEAF